MRDANFSTLGIFRMRPKKPSSDAVFPLGLGAEGVHEIAEAAFGDFPALTGFALAASQSRPGEAHGRLYQEGLSAFKAKPPACIHVQTHKLSDALWATEEGLTSRAASLIVAELSDLDFTASRRLTLAAQRCGVPVLLLMPYTREGATAATARWRISPRPSRPNPFDPQAPGAPRWSATLERSRLAPHLTPLCFDLEHDDETLSLSVASGLAADTAATAPPTDTQPATLWARTG